MKVVHFHRAKGLGVSIERLFDHVRSALPNDFEVETKYLPHGGTHPLNLLRNCWFAFQNQGDVNHVTGDCHYIALAMNWRKTILTIHDCANLHKLSGLKRWIFKKIWYDLPCKLVKKVTVVSEFSKREILELVGMPSNKVDVIYNCVDPCFKPDSKRKCIDPPIVLQIGTKANKNLERITVALKDIDCHLRIVGKISNVQKEELEKNGIVYSNVFHISDQELVNEFANADLMLFVSTYEGFGLPIIEAQAIGLPVITSNIDPMKEVAGCGALFVDPFDVASIRTQVKVALQSNLKNVIVQGFSNVRRFQSVQIAGHYQKVYEEVANAS